MKTIAAFAIIFIPIVIFLMLCALFILYKVFQLILED